MTRCPTCHRPYVSSAKIAKALKLVDAGEKQASAARKVGISRQLLSQKIALRRKLS